MKTILLVDDSKTIISQLELSIKRDIKNVNILIAYTFKEAVKHILKSGKIHLAILDLNLPDASMGDIVDFTLGKKIPSIVLTGLINEDLKQFILKKDVLDFYNKQNIKNIDRLISKIDRSLKNYDCNVLLVEDSSSDREIAKKYLDTMNLNVTIANNGQEALEIINAENDKFDLVLTDYNMPLLNGMDLTVNLRQTHTKDKLGIIVVSSNDKVDIATDFLKMGANDFITKPYTKTQFITRIDTTLELLDLFRKTKDLANKDFLTGSYNRRFFFESAQTIFDKAKRSNNPLAVAMFDIDKFKNINDTYGHDVGDEAIKEIPKVLNEHLKKSDLVARFGGEEFCVLLENITIEEAKNLFEKIRAAFEANILNVGDLRLKFTTSIGVCYGMEETLDLMIKKADEGLYFCKQNGRNKVHININ